MKTYIALIVLCVIMLSQAACSEDKGNYDYAEREEITFSGVEKEYTRVYMNGRLTVMPVVESTIPDAKFEYLWTISASGGLGDTLALTARLDTLVNWSPGKTYTLVLAATNKVTGFTAYHEAGLIVSTPYSRGWYVLKDNGEQADIDLYAESGKIGNILAAVNGHGLNGVAQKMSFISAHEVFDLEVNKYTGHKTLFVMTDRDLVGIDISDGRVIRRFGDFFFEVPKVCSPSMMFEMMTSTCLINNGKVHSIGNMSDNSGKLGVAKSTDNQNDYRLSKHGYCDQFADLLVFDEVGSSFYTTTDYISNLMAVPDGPGSEMSCRRNNKKLLYMGNKDVYFGSMGYAVMQDKTDPEVKMISRLDLKKRPSYISISNDTILPDHKAFTAELFTLSRTEEVLYFVSGGILWSRNIAGKRGKETEQFIIPAGEMATFVKYIKYSEEGISFNYVVLGTQAGDQYKVRFFAKTSGGNIVPEPEFTLPGEGQSAVGHAGDVLYISPKLNGDSYIHTY